MSGEKGRAAIPVCNGDAAFERTAHGDLVGDVGIETLIKVCRIGLEMCRQSTIGQRQIVVLLLVHFLVDDILLGDAERATGATFVNLRGATSRLDAGFQTAIGATRCSDIGAFLVFFVGAF